MSEEWREDAECRGMTVTIFVPAKAQRGRPVNSDYSTAKAVCAVCKVKQKCLDFALNSGFNEFGMYGGMTPKQRQRLLRERRVAVKQA